MLCKLYLRITVIHPLKNAKVESQPKNWSWHLGWGSIHGKMSIFQIPHSKGPIPAACGKFICHMRGPSERHNGIKMSYSTVKWKESDGWSGRYLEQTRLWFQIPYSERSWKIQKTDQFLWSIKHLFFVTFLWYTCMYMYWCPFLTPLYSLPLR